MKTWFAFDSFSVRFWFAFDSLIGSPVFNAKAQSRGGTKFHGFAEKFKFIWNKWNRVANARTCDVERTEPPKGGTTCFLCQRPVHTMAYTLRLLANFLRGSS